MKLGTGEGNSTAASSSTAKNSPQVDVNNSHLADVTNTLQTDVTNTNRNPNFGVRAKGKGEKAIDLETRKIDLFRRKLDKDERNEDADLCFLKGLMPEFKKAVRVAKLKRKITEVVNEFLDEEAWLYPKADGN